MSQKVDEKTVLLGTESNGNETKKAARTVARPDLVKEVNLQIPLTVAVPMMAILGVAVGALLVGLFLLNLPHEHTPAVALALSINILAAATFAASRPQLTGRTIAELAILVIYPIALAVILVNLGIGEPAEVAAAETSAAPAAAEAAAVEIGASNLEFSTDELTFPADQDTTLTFDNQDVAPHNLSIYADDTLKKDFFSGPNVDAGATTEYEIPALEAGAYYFRCDLHPTMEGRLIVE